MPGLLRVERPLGALQRGVRRNAGRLVEQQHAIDAAPRNSNLAQPSASFLSAATASSISCDSRMPDSIESSYAKCS